MKDGALRALDMHVLEDTGAYGTHALTVGTVSGLRGLSTYRSPNLRFALEAVYTNKPTPGAFRGYGAPQALFALECLMEEIALELKLDPVEFRLKNAIRVGDEVSSPELWAKAKKASSRLYSRAPCRSAWSKAARLSGGIGRPTLAGASTRSGRTFGAGWAWLPACMAPPSPGWTWARPASR
jgi:CO/xanthine dehydrogenase Mo-binding subunit